MMSDHRNSLRSVAGRSVSPEYMKILNGLEIGECAASCGTVAFVGHPVFVTDASTDPLWADFRDVADRFNVCACWSTPFFSQSDKVLGTFAISHVSRGFQQASRRN